MIELPEGICYSPKPPGAYLPHDTTHVFFAKHAKSLPAWNMMWLTQPALDDCLTLDKNKWSQWGAVTKAMNPGLVGRMSASLNLDDNNLPPGMVLRHFLTLPPLDFLRRLKQREWWNIAMFEDPSVMGLVEARAHLSAGVEYVASVDSVTASEATSIITEVVGNVAYAEFRSADKVRLVRDGQELDTLNNAAISKATSSPAKETPVAIQVETRTDAPTKREIFEHFVDNGDGTVTDTRTGLMWMRCALGQTWDGTTCVGEAKGYTWEEAMALHHGFAGHDDWRLPSIHELRNIFGDELKKVFGKTRGNPVIDISFGGKVDKAATLESMVNVGVKLAEQMALHGNSSLAVGTLKKIEGKKGVEACALRAAMVKLRADLTMCQRRPEMLDCPAVKAALAEWKHYAQLTCFPVQVKRADIVTATAFPNASRHFWSDSVYAGNSDSAWSIYFNYGYDGTFNKTYSLQVRLVRGGPPLDYFESRASQIDISSSSKNGGRVAIVDSRISDSLARIERMGDVLASAKPTVRAAIDFIRQQPELFAAEIAELRVFLGEPSFTPSIAPVKVVTSALPEPQTLAQIIAWLATLEMVTVSDLRTRLLPLDLLPGAVIDDLNERALDLTGDLALEEDGEKFIIVREVLAQVVSAW